MKRIPKIVVSPSGARVRDRKKPHILLDMDEVLVDFVGGACAAHGVTREWLEARRTLGQWAMNDLLDKSLDEFWEPIHAKGIAFWQRLDPLPWLHDVVALISRYDPHWRCVTAPARGTACRMGKILWFAQHLGNRELERLLLINDKHVLAQAHHLLIDDREQNIEDFVEAGGDGIIFPSFTNTFAAHAQDPIPRLEMLLAERYNQ